MEKAMNLSWLTLIKLEQLLYNHNNCHQNLLINTYVPDVLPFLFQIKFNTESSYGLHSILPICVSTILNISVHFDYIPAVITFQNKNVNRWILVIIRLWSSRAESSS